ncbi:MAG: S8 family serine peptidase [Candidatus Sumerlaeia bacterium]|nr:S8 family serine peptidase [Candidatus Sumerlaeia bacterium]
MEVIRRSTIGAFLLSLFVLMSGFGPGGAGSQPGEVVVRFTAPPRVAPPADKTAGALWQYVAADKQFGGGRLAVLDWFAEQGLVGVEPLVHAPAGKAVKSKTPDELRTTSPIHRLVFAPDADVSAIVEQLGRTAGVLWAEPNWRGTLAYTPTDPLWSNQEAKYDVVGLREAWDIQQGADASVRVAVIDTGIDAGHPEFDGVIDLAASYNFADGNATVADDNGHGTRIAGLIGARANNGEGIAGTAFGATLLSLDVATTDGAITSANVVSALQWAIAHDAHVAHLGFTFGLKSVALENACREASDAGILLVAAAGNRNQGSSPAYPASYDSVLGVGAVLDNGTTRAPWSNFNGSDETLVDLVAPGEMVFSTIPGSQYNGTFGSGTSFAAPFVAGAAALLKSMYPDQSGAAIGAHLRATASPLGTWAGSGLLDAHAALATPMVPNVILVSVTVDDDPAHSAANDGDGIFDVGESVRIVVSLHSTCAAVADVTATLSTASPHITTLGNATADFARIDHLVASSNAAEPFGLVVADGAAPAGDVPFLLELAAPGGFSASIPLNVRLDNLFTAPVVIDTDTTWTNDRTWLIQSGCTVMEGATLTIEPGTTVRFAETPERNGRLEVRGGIVSLGTIDQPIRFTSVVDKPTGGFGEQVRLSTGQYPHSVAYGDVNGDGLSDIVVANTGSDDISVFLWSDQGYLPELRLAVGSEPASVAIGDVEGDGVNEILVANRASDTVSVIRWSGADFLPPLHIPVGGHPLSIAVGDLDNSGRDAIVTANFSTNDISVVRWNGSSFGPEVSHAVGTRPVRVGIADLDGNGYKDVAVANLDSRDMSILRGFPTGLRAQTRISIAVPSWATPPAIIGVAFGDPLSRGTIGLLALTGAVSMFEWDGVSFVYRSAFGANESPEAVAVGDATNDGIDNIIVANFGGYVTVQHGSSYGSHVKLIAGAGTSDALVGDLNKDGRNDVLAANRYSHDISLFPWRDDRSWEARHAGVWIRSQATQARFSFTTVEFGSVRDESTVGDFRDFTVAWAASTDEGLWTPNGTVPLLRCSVLGNGRGGGIYAGSKELIECVAEDTQGYGLYGGILTRCRAIRNTGWAGMMGTSATGCIAHGNAQMGILIRSGGSVTATDCVAIDNGSRGISGDNVVRCIALRNNIGIVAVNTFDSFAAYNLDGGVVSWRIERCTAIGNGGSGLSGRFIVDGASVGNKVGIGSDRALWNMQRSYIAESWGPTAMDWTDDGEIASSVFLRNEGMVWGANSGVASLTHTWIIGNGIGTPAVRTVASSRISLNAGLGMSIGSSMTASLVDRNGDGGIAASGNASVTSSAIIDNQGAGARGFNRISGSILHGNSTYDYVASAAGAQSTSADLRGNHWGPETTAFMDAHPFGPGTTGNVPAIRDIRDDPSLVEVDYSDHLATPPMTLASLGPNNSAPAFLLEANTDRAEPLGVGVHELILTYSEPMRTHIPLSVTWGKESPYDSNVVLPNPGWMTNTTWRGDIVVGAQTPAGEHRIRVSGPVAVDSFAVPDDTAHRFSIDVSSLASVNTGIVVPVGVDGAQITWTEIGRPETARGYNLLATPREGISAQALQSGQFTLTRKVNGAPLDDAEFLDAGLAQGRYHVYAVHLVGADSNALPWTGLFSGRTGPASGTVAVAVSPASASWQFSDSSGGTHSGTGDRTVTSVPIGAITLTWQPLADHGTPMPNPETKFLELDETLSFTGVYTPDPLARLDVSPSSRQIAHTAGATSFAVSNGGAGVMHWTAEVTAGGSWLSITSGESGSGPGTIACAATANSGKLARTGTIRVTSGQAPNSPVTLNVTQLSFDDRFESNDTWLEAQLGEGIRVGETVANLRSFDEDWYRIEFAPGESIRVRVLFNHAAGNLNAELYDIREFDENGVPFRVGESYSPNHPWVWSPTAGDGATAPQWNAVPWGPAHADDEWITYVNTTGASELYLRVYGEGGVENNNYAVAVDSLGTDDAFEPNDSIAQAKPIALDTRLEGLIGKNNDFFRVDVSGVDAIRVRVACYALLGTMYFEVHGMRPEGEVGPLEEGKMYEPNRYEASRTVCVQGLDEVFVRVYPSVRMPNVYNLVVETVSECP